MRVFISQPMRDKSDFQIKMERVEAKAKLQKMYPNDEIEIIDTYLKVVPYDANPLWYLGESIKRMSKADLVYFLGNWKDYRGCRAEHFVAEDYGLTILEE